MINFRAFLLLLSFVCTLSFAGVESVAGKYQYALSGCFSESVAGACACAVAKGNSGNSFETRFVSASEVTHVCAYDYREKGGTGDWSRFSQVLAPSFVCPSGYSPSGNPGFCDRPSEEGPGKCQDKNTYVRAWYAGPGFAYPAGDNGCVIVVLNVEKCYEWSSGVNAGKTICYYLVQRTGAPYTGPESGAGGAPPPGDSSDKGKGATPPMEPPPGNGCPAGTQQIGTRASGDPICIPTGTGTGSADNPPAAPPKSTTSTSAPGPGGSTVKTDSTVSKNSDGSTTVSQVTTTTSGDGKSVSVEQSKTTSASVSGQPGKEDVPEDRMNLCKTNPNLNICKNSSTSGSCGQIACSGDAIQCATLRAAAAMECRGKEDVDELSASPQRALGAAIGSGNDPMKGQIEEVMAGSTVDLGASTLDSSGFLGGGACFQPLNFVVAGRSVSYSFDAICTAIIPIRVVVMALCTLFGYLVVARSVIGG